MTTLFAKLVLNWTKLYHTVFDLPAIVWDKIDKIHNPKGPLLFPIVISNPRNFV